MVNFFSDTNDCEEMYKVIRDENNNPRAVIAKGFIENLWVEFSKCISRKRREWTLNNAKKQLFQVYWEMYFYCAMRELGIEIEFGCSQGPDFFVKIGEQKYWIETVVPTRGQGEFQVPKWNETNTTHEDKIALRYTNALSNKQEQYEKALNAGIIEKDDGFILAINSSIFEREPYYGLPYFVQSLLPVGDLTIGFSKQNQSFSDMYFNRQDEIRKKEKPVPKDSFLDAKNCFYSAVLHSSVSYKFEEIHFKNQLSYDFSILHNPLASVPLKCKDLSWSDQYSVSINPDGSFEVKVPKS